MSLYRLQYIKLYIDRSGSVTPKAIFDQKRIYSLMYCAKMKHNIRMIEKNFLYLKSKSIQRDNTLQNTFQEMHRLHSLECRHCLLSRCVGMYINCHVLQFQVFFSCKYHKEVLVKVLSILEFYFMLYFLCIP